VIAPNRILLLALAPLMHTGPARAENVVQVLQLVLRDIRVVLPRDALSQQTRVPLQRSAQVP
jgi:hypothetical protein